MEIFLNISTCTTIICKNQNDNDSILVVDTQPIYCLCNVINTHTKNTTMVVYYDSLIKFEYLLHESNKDVFNTENNCLICCLTAFNCWQKFCTRLLFWLFSLRIFKFTRTGWTKVYNIFVSHETILKGVRQGDILSPTLFSLYMDDVSKMLKYCSSTMNFFFHSLRD